MTEKNESLETEIHNIKVLVVEDIPLNQLLMKTLLNDFNFDFDIASNGKIALELLKINTYDIVLMDLQMPEMNGFEATDYIRKTLKSNIPIIALTADVTTVDLAKSKSVGMNDYLAKPIDERLLYSKIVALVKKPIPKLILKENSKKEINPKILKKCTNLDYLKKHTKGNSELIKEMIELFLDQTPELINIIKKSIKKLNWEQLQSAVHKILPSFYIVGIDNKYTELANEIQILASKKIESKLLNESIQELVQISKQACTELKTEHNKIIK